MNRTVLLIVGVAALAAVVAVAVLTLGGGDDAPEFGKGSYEEITDALKAEKLIVCDEDTSGANVMGAYEGRTYTITLSECDTGELVPGHGLVVVDAYSTSGGLDKIDGDAYVGDSALGYRWQQYIIGTTQSTAPDELEAFRDAMDGLGAKQVYDNT